MEEKQGISFSILTVSDRCFGGLADDNSGIELKRLIEEATLFTAAKVISTGIVPDEVSQIRGSVIYFCDVIKVNVLLITGGTTIAPGDVTAERLSVWMERQVPGLTRMLPLYRLAALKHHPECNMYANAALLRTIAGVRNKTLIVSLPGSVDVSVEVLKAIADVLPHAVDVITDQKNEVALTHGEKIEINPKPKRKVSLLNGVNNFHRNYPMKLMSELPDLFQKFVPPLDIVQVPTADAFGYVLAKNVVSLENVPHCVSVKDGYATTTPWTNINYIKSHIYNIIGEMSSDGRLLFYGSYTQKDFDDGKAIKITKGSPLPPKTNYVFPIEITKPSDPGNIILPESGTNNYIREIQSDVCGGQVVILTNELLTQTALGALAAIGQQEISVFRKPVVAILSSGDELLKPRGLLKVHRSCDSNKIVLKSLLSSWGYEVIDLGIAPDEPDDVLNELQTGFASADVVITTGDISMDQRDIIKDVLYQDLGMNIHFGSLGIKPGESTGFGTLNTSDLNSKYWFGLPVDPVATFVTAHLVVSPVLKMLSGWRSNIFQKKITAKAGHNISNVSYTGSCNKLEYQQGSLSYSNIDGSVLEMPVFSTTGYLNQRNSSIFGCVNASCLLEVPVGKSYKKDDKIIVLLLE